MKTKVFHLCVPHISIINNCIFDGIKRKFANIDFESSACHTFFLSQTTPIRWCFSRTDKPTRNSKSPRIHYNCQSAYPNKRSIYRVFFPFFLFMNEIMKWNRLYKRYGKKFNMRVRMYTFYGPITVTIDVSACGKNAYCCHPMSCAQ